MKLNERGVPLREADDAGVVGHRQVLMVLGNQSGISRDRIYH